MSGRARLVLAAFQARDFQVDFSSALACCRKKRGPFTPDQTYQDTAKSIGSDRIALAGARLARLFNASLK